MKISDLKNIKSILIIRLSSLGDILLSTPLIRTIKKSFIDISVDMIIKEQYHDVMKLNPHLRKLFLFNPDQADEFYDKIRIKKYDLVIDLQSNFHSGNILRQINDTQIIKFDKLSLRKFILVQSKINMLRNAGPIPVRYADTVPGLELDNKGLDLITDSEPSPILKSENHYIGICPGSRHFTKMWPKDYFIKLIRMLIKDGWNIILFGGKSDRLSCLEIKNEVPEVINLQNDDKILQIAADMKFCRAIYCNDSGLMHTACAVKIPVITFFGSTVKEFGFAPYKNKNIVLENPFLACRPCSHIGKRKCPKKHFKCMNDITPQIAYEALEMVLKS